MSAFHKGGGGLYQPRHPQLVETASVIIRKTKIQKKFTFLVTGTKLFFIYKEVAHAFHNLENRLNVVVI